MDGRVIELGSQLIDGTCALKQADQFQRTKLIERDVSNTRRIFALTHKEAKILYEYLQECHFRGFTGIHNFQRVNSSREYFYRWFLDEIINKLKRKRPGSMVNLTLTQPELITLKAMFQRVFNNKEMLQLESKFVKPKKIRNASNSKTTQSAGKKPLQS